MRVFLASVLMVFTCAAPALADVHMCGHARLRTAPAARLVKWNGPLAQGRGFPTVGDKRDMWTYDLSVMPPKNVSIPATCRGVGEHSAIWVADDQWESKVGQPDVDTLLEALESATPRTPDSGVVANNATLFGDPPVFAQGDPDLTLFLYDIPDYGNYHFDGFFRAEDLAPYNPACAGNPMVYCSNELGMIHVDAVNAASAYMQGVIAHEYEHLAHYGADTFEENWLDESLAELAMAYSGYEDPGNLNYYLAHPDSSLVVEPPVDYGACFLFGSYLYQRLGIDGVNGLVASPLKGVASVESALIKQDFETFFAQWTVANVLDRPDIDEGQYGHDLIDVAQIKSKDVASMPASIQASMAPTAAAYHVFGGTGVETQALELTFDPGASEALAHVFVPETGRVSLLNPDDLVKIGGVDAQHVTWFVFANPDPNAGAQATLEASQVHDAPAVVEDDSDVVEQIDAAGGTDAVTDPDVPISEDLAVEPDLESDAAQLVDTSGEEPEEKKSSGGCSQARSDSSCLLLLALLGLILAALSSRKTHEQRV